MQQIRFQQYGRVRIAGTAKPVTDKERGVRPRRLRQILDRGADAAIPFDQEDIARPQTAAQLHGTARRERLVTTDRLVEVPGYGAADGLE